MFVYLSELIAGPQANSLLNRNETEVLSEQSTHQFNIKKKENGKREREIYLELRYIINSTLSTSTAPLSNMAIRLKNIYISTLAYLSCLFSLHFINE